MILYECKYCNIKTSNKNNYENHLKTKKHLKNETKFFKRRKNKWVN